MELIEIGRYHDDDTARPKVRCIIHPALRKDGHEGSLIASNPRRSLLNILLYTVLLSHVLFPYYFVHQLHDKT